MTAVTSLRRTMMTGKIHRATVTEADLHYVGSVTVDGDLLDAAGLLAGERVDIVDVTNGARLSTYLIAGEPGGGQICINGAAAHLVHPGDVVILIAYGSLADAEARAFTPRVVFVDASNRIVEVSGEPGGLPDAGRGMHGGLEPSTPNAASAPLGPRSLTLRK